MDEKRVERRPKNNIPAKKRHDMTITPLLKKSGDAAAIRAAPIWVIFLVILAESKSCLLTI